MNNKINYRHLLVLGITLKAPPELMLNSNPVPCENLKNILGITEGAKLVWNNHIKKEEAELKTNSGNTIDSSAKLSVQKKNSDYILPSSEYGYTVLTVEVC